jgi:serine phosphatase RsbU (regulator of sigma subunit)
VYFDDLTISRHFFRHYSCLKEKTKPLNIQILNLVSYMPIPNEIIILLREYMQVAWTKSLSTKLFLLMAVSLIITVAGTVYQNSTMFKDFLSRQLEDKTVQSAKETATSIESILENWTSITSVAMHNIPNKTNKGFQQFLNNFLAANPEFVSFQVVSTNGQKSKPIVHSFTSNIDDIRFEENDIVNLKSNITKNNDRWLQKLLKQKKPRSKYIQNQNGRLNLPLSTIAIRYSIENDSAYNWAIVTVWQSRLMKAMPHSNNQTSFIISPLSNKRSKISLSPLDYSKWKNTYRNNFKLSKASRVDSPFGFKAYKNLKGESIIGAFHKIRDFGLTVAVSADAKASYLAIRNIILKSTLWALVYLVGFLGLSYLSSTNVTKGLRKLTQATLQIANGNFNVNLEAKSKDEVGLLSHAVNHMSNQIRDLLVSKVEQARQEKELETAKLIQETLFPAEKATNIPSISIRARNTPASECGGDWWYHHTTASGKELIIIADATGHGVSAALVTAMAFSGYQMLIDHFSSEEDELTPCELLYKLNSVLYKAGNGSSTMTGLVCILDPDSGQLTMANAGHNLPFLLPKDAGDIRLNNKPNKKRQKRVKSIQANGHPMGLDPVWSGNEVTMQLEPGDKLLLYTDGIFECGNKDGEQWGSRRFRNNLELNAESGAGDFLNNLFDEAFKFLDGTAPDDDITVVVAEISDEWQSAKSVA